MDQWVNARKTFAAMPHDASSISAIYMEEGEN